MKSKIYKVNKIFLWFLLKKNAICIGNTGHIINKELMLSGKFNKSSLKTYLCVSLVTFFLKYLSFISSSFHTIKLAVQSNPK